ncbi:MAG: class I SAM-dependent methyltransferase [Acidobacteria bacterium]|nr:class I SAM-dependent methyltransferase [Acidobacteriota bacterium]
MPRTQVFDRYSERYEKWFERNSFVYRSELRAIKYLLPPAGIGIEIGTGSGRFAAPLGIKIGIEPSQNMAKLAQARGVQVCNAVAEHLPFRAAYFDYALMVTTICFLDDVQTSFQEVARVLKASGHFIIGFVDRDSLLGRIYHEHKSENVFYREATFYSVEEVLGLLRTSGFGFTRIVQTVFGNVQDVTRVQEFKRGHGEGSFAVIRSRRLGVNSARS